MYRRGVPLVAVLFCFALQQPAPEFEVASFKVSRMPAPGEPLAINLGTLRPNGVTFGNVALSDCMKFAYSLVSDSQIAGPDWIKSGEVRYDIIAQAPVGATQDQMRLMVQSLLAARLKLGLHHEQRPLPYLALTVGKTGIKFGEAKPEGAVSLRGGRIIHNHMPMQILATLLSRFERQLVMDMTGLNGFYEIKLEWTPDNLRGRTAEGGGPILLNGEAVDPDGPSLVTALSEQLGLRLESRKGPVDVLVVDRAEKVPTPN